MRAVRAGECLNHRRFAREKHTIRERFGQPLAQRGSTLR